MREAWGGGEWRNIHYLFTVETEEMGGSSGSF